MPRALCEPDRRGLAEGVEDDGKALVAALEGVEVASFLVWTILGGLGSNDAIIKLSGICGQVAGDQGIERSGADGTEGSDPELVVGIPSPGLVEFGVVGVFWKSSHVVASTRREERDEFSGRKSGSVESVGLSRLGTVSRRIGSDFEPV